MKIKRVAFTHPYFDFWTVRLSIGAMSAEGFGNTEQAAYSRAMFRLRGVVSEQASDLRSAADSLTRRADAYEQWLSGGER